MDVYVTGPNGYIGKALVEAGAFPMLANITDPISLKREIEEKKPDVILHLASKSDPDWCEKEENTSVLYDVNVRGTYNVMHHASQSGIPCVLMSTGQVWKGGFWEREHREEDKLTHPVNQYGLSKLEAEVVVQSLFFGYGCKIIRSSYVFDFKRLAAKLGFLREGVELHEPTFIKRSFIYLNDIVSLLLEYCERIGEMPNILHLAGRDTVGWFDFTKELACQYGYDDGLVRPRRTEVEGLVPRPGNAGLNTSLARSLGFRIPGYKEGIKRMKNES